MRRFISIFLVLILLLTGCSAANNPQSNQDNQDIAGNFQTTYPVTVVDDIGQNVTLSTEPQRIISLLPSSTEILCALNQDPIAVTQWDDYPEYIMEKAEFVFQDPLNPNLEQIINLEPDLIMYWKTSTEDLAKIRNLGVPVAVFEATNIAGVYKNIEKIGILTNSQEQANKLIEQMQAKEKSIEEKVALLSEDEKHKVWLELDNNLYTAGSGTFLDELIIKAGGVNIATDIQGWGQFNSEQVIARNPDVIIETYSYMDKQVVENIKTRPGWQNIEAVKSNMVFSLDNNIISRQGPRIVEGLELMAKAIYPELFNENN
jgi:iron complex transport system substrate-binding protein